MLLERVQANREQYNKYLRGLAVVVLMWFASVYICGHALAWYLKK